jgi:hypothetical protein
MAYAKPSWETRPCMLTILDVHLTQRQWLLIMYTRISLQYTYRNMSIHYMCAYTVKKYEYALYVYVYCREIRVCIICVRILTRNTSMHYMCTYTVEKYEYTLYLVDSILTRLYTRIYHSFGVTSDLTSRLLHELN